MRLQQLSRRRGTAASPAGEGVMTAPRAGLRHRTGTLPAPAKGLAPGHRQTQRSWYCRALQRDERGGSDVSFWHWLSLWHVKERSRPVAPKGSLFQVRRRSLNALHTCSWCLFSSVSAPPWEIQWAKTIPSLGFSQVTDVAPSHSTKKKNGSPGVRCFGAIQSTNHNNALQYFPLLQSQFL